VNRATWLNGPEPTGCGFVNVAGLPTLPQMCCGTTNVPFRVVEMNCESTVFSLITTVYLPLAVIEAMFDPGREEPRMSIVFCCVALLPPLRL
jgi:hypothetical protein